MQHNFKTGLLVGVDNMSAKNIQTWLKIIRLAARIFKANTQRGARAERKRGRAV